MTDAPKIGVRLATITPKQAEKLLEDNTHNRMVRDTAVAQYAADMKAGNWQLNGEAIKVAASGRILDGQHRLIAIADAGVPVETLLITGLPDEAQETMDQGRSRSFGDILKLRGEKEYTTLSVAVRIIATYEKYGAPVAPFSAPPLSVAQMLRTLAHNPELRETIPVARRLRRPWLPISLTAALLHLFSAVNEEDALDFFTRLSTGDGLEAGSALHTLRERLMKEHYELGGINQRVRLAFIVVAWNHYSQGFPLKRLAWHPGGSNPDKFPAIFGLADTRHQTEVIA